MGTSDVLQVHIRYCLGYMLSYYKQLLQLIINERILLRLSLNFSGQSIEPEPLIDFSICSLNAQKEQNPSSPSSSAQGYKFRNWKGLHTMLSHDIAQQKAKAIHIKSVHTRIDFCISYNYCLVLGNIISALNQSILYPQNVNNQI